MASIRYRPDRKLPHEVRYRDRHGRQRSQSFKSPKDAKAFAAEVETELRHGRWIDPAKGRVTVEEWTQEWLNRHPGLEPKTRRTYLGALRTHVWPHIGGIRLNQVEHADVQEMVKSVIEAGASHATAVHARTVLAMAMTAAIKDHRIPSNPCEGVRVPRRRAQREMLFLTPVEVARLAARTPPPYDLLVIFAANTGLRWGELAALTVADIDWKNKLVHVRRALKESREVGDTKTHAERRVAVRREVYADLREHVERHGLRGGDLLWSDTNGGHLRDSNFRRRVWKPAVVAAELDPQLRFHDLRHTCATWLIAAGHNAKAVMQWMGHSSITVTFDRYGHLFHHEIQDMAVSLAKMWNRPEAYGTGRASLNGDLAASTS